MYVGYFCTSEVVDPSKELVWVVHLSQDHQQAPRCQGAFALGEGKQRKVVTKDFLLPAVNL